MIKFYLNPTLLLELTKTNRIFRVKLNQGGFMKYLIIFIVLFTLLGCGKEDAKKGIVIPVFEQYCNFELVMDIEFPDTVTRRSEAYSCHDAGSRQCMYYASVADTSVAFNNCQALELEYSQFEVVQYCEIEQTTVSVMFPDSVTRSADRHNCLNKVTGPCFYYEAVADPDINFTTCPIVVEVHL
jgi:hypothetical protein